MRLTEGGGPYVPTSVGISLPSAFYYISRHVAPTPSPKAQERLRWLSAWQALRKQGLSSTRASRVLALPRSTLYRWQKLLKQEGPRGLEPRSHRPKRLRRPTWSPELAQEVLRLREEYPRWGKDPDKSGVVLLRRQDLQISTSMVGRILKNLKARGILKEPPRLPVSARRRSRKRPYAVRKPQEYQAQQPGDLVQVDTLDVRPLPGVVLKHFTARDVLSRWDVMQVYKGATAEAAKAFLQTLQARLPFPLKAIQVDGGSEFRAGFEKACRQQGLQLFVLPPRSPKLNGHVERAQRTHIEEFYEVYPGPLDLPTLNQALRDWEQTYNHIRPHQALDWRTPAEYIREHHPEAVPKMARLSQM